MKEMNAKAARTSRWGGRTLFAALLLVSSSSFLFAARPAGGRPAGQSQPGEECLACHGEKSLTTTRGGKTVSLFVDAKKFAASVHGSLGCTGCHADLEGKELPHDTPLAKVNCGTCHDGEQGQYARSLHGKAVARGDPLAPRCVDCHGNHDILPVKDARSALAPLKIPYVCGRCHQEGTPVQINRPIPQDKILENYSESIHGEALLRKGLVIAPSCATCHTAHLILPHTDPASSIARRNIAATCTKCHAQIETVHRKIINGALWEKEVNVLPACVDCHQPHKIRKVFYTQGMADADCLRCHANEHLKRARDGAPLYVRSDDIGNSRHARVACSQCHSEVNASRVRPCETITRKVDCSACHDAIGREYLTSAHGQLASKKDPNAPSCKDCHGTHGVLGRQDPRSPTFATNVPALCANCHREGEKAAVRYTGGQHDIVKHYTESIHGKGLLKSGLTVTATCTSCHTAHHVLPRSDPESTVNAGRVPTTCGQCHHGIEEQFESSIHARRVTKTDKALPVCNDCHTAHSIRRTDEDAFRLDIMSKCGRCHQDLATAYFDTYHGKVSRLGYAKTAKCWDCHGSHDILPPSDVRSHLSRVNVVSTCEKCHAGATRRFAGYLTHATHHDPRKYPFLFFAFWGMTALLVSTFVVSGLHTLLWLPRALQMRRELRAAEAESSPPGPAAVSPAAELKPRQEEGND